jgi:hypothetical protein
MKNILAPTSLTAACILSITIPLQADEATAIAALREAGFRLKQTSDATEIGWGQPEWTPDTWQRLGEITSLTTLRGTARCADNAGLQVLVKLPRLKSLYLNASTFDDDGFAILAQVKSLETLALDHNGTITGAGASALKVLPHLKSLRFGGCMKFTGEGVQASAELAQLESLQLHHCRVGDADLPSLARLPRLKSLFVSSQFDGRLTGAGLKNLVQIQSLESLKVSEFVVTYDEGLDTLTRLRGLRKLELHKVGATAEDIEKLRNAMPQTEIEWTPASDEEIANYERRAARRK